MFTRDQILAVCLGMLGPTFAAAGMAWRQSDQVKANTAAIHGIKGELPKIAGQITDLKTDLTKKIDDGNALTRTDVRELRTILLNRK